MFYYQFLIVVWMVRSKKYSFLLISMFLPISRKKPRYLNFSAVFAILNIRNRVKTILFCWDQQTTTLWWFCKRKIKKMLKTAYLVVIQIFEFFEYFSEIFSIQIYFFSQNMLVLIQKFEWPPNIQFSTFSWFSFCKIHHSEILIF